MAVKGWRLIRSEFFDHDSRVNIAGYSLTNIPYEYSDGHGLALDNSGSLHRGPHFNPSPLIHPHLLFHFDSLFPNFLYTHILSGGLSLHFLPLAISYVGIEGDPEKAQDFNTEFRTLKALGALIVEVFFVGYGG